MEFRIQEIIKMLVPGGVILINLYFLFFSFTAIETLLNKDFIAIYIFIFTILTYVAGYFIDWIASLSEKLYYSIFTKPSERLLNNLSKSKIFGIRMSRHREVGESLCAYINQTATNRFDKYSAEKLFRLANVIKDQNMSDHLKEKISDFYFYKIFSRNLATAFFLTFITYPMFYFLSINSVVTIFEQPENLPTFSWDFLFALLFSIFSFLRWKEHATYYTRLIFYTACPDVFQNAGSPTP
jgi:hypothetical protein